MLCFPVCTVLYGFPTRRFWRDCGQFHIKIQTQGFLPCVCFYAGYFLISFFAYKGFVILYPVFYGNDSVVFLIVSDNDLFYTCIYNHSFTH